MWPCYPVSIYWFYTMRRHHWSLICHQTNKEQLPIRLATLDWFGLLVKFKNPSLSTIWHVIYCLIMIRIGNFYIPILFISDIIPSDILLMSCWCMECQTTDVPIFRFSVIWSAYPMVSCNTIYLAWYLFPRGDLQCSERGVQVSCSRLPMVDLGHWDSNPPSVCFEVWFYCPTPKTWQLHQWHLNDFMPCGVIQWQKKIRPTILKSFFIVVNVHKRFKSRIVLGDFFFTPVWCGICSTWREK